MRVIVNVRRRWGVVDFLIFFFVEQDNMDEAKAMRLVERRLNVRRVIRSSVSGRGDG